MIVTLTLEQICTQERVENGDNLICYKLVTSHTLVTHGITEFINQMLKQAIK